MSRSTRRRAAARPRSSAASSPRSSSCSRCQAASACISTASAPAWSSTVGDQAALLADLAQREAAPRRLEQVGGEQRVVDEVRRARRPAPWRRGRSPARSPSAATSGSGPSVSPTRTRSPDGDAEAPLRVLGEQLALGRGRARTTATATSASAPSAATSASEPSRTRASIVRLGRPARARGVASSPNASSRRASGARSSNSRNTSRSRERSGSRAGLGGRVDLDRDVAHDRRELLGDARVVGVVGQVLLALGARDLVDVGEHRPRATPNRCRSSRGGLVADPRDAGDVVRRVALEAVEVGDQVGGDPVAVDDGVVVVDLGVGDPAARRHDPHVRVRVDDLEGVAVAGDDHHRDALPRARARRSWRSRRRPRSRPRARCDSRRPRRAARGAATAP